METRLGMGSTVRFVLPFSVMMTRVVTVEAGGQVFGIPLDAVIETVRIPREQILFGGKRTRLRVTQPNDSPHRIRPNVGPRQRPHLA